MWLQAVAKEGQASRLLLRVKLAHPPSCGSLPALLHLCGAGSFLGYSPAKPVAAAAGPAAAGAASVKLRPQDTRHTDSPKARAGLSGGSPHSSCHSSADMEAAEAGTGRPAGSRSVRGPAADGDEGWHSGRNGGAAAGGGRGLRFAAAEEGYPEPEQAEAEEHRNPRRKGPSSGRYVPGAEVDEDDDAAVAEAAAAGDWGDPSQDGSEQNAGQWENMRSPMASGRGNKLSILQSSLYRDSGGGGDPGHGKPGARSSFDPGARGSMDRRPLVIGGPRSSMEGRHMAAGKGRGSMDGPLPAAGRGRGSMELGPVGYLEPGGYANRGPGAGALGFADSGPGGGDGASDVGSEDDASKLDIGSASEADGGEFGEDDITCDWRCANSYQAVAAL